MSNTITIELCPEDRARLDRLAEALEKRVTQEAPVNTEGVDTLNRKLGETLARASEPVEAPKNATGAAEASTPTTTPPKEETPKDEKPAQPATEKTVNQKDIRALYVTLCSKSKKKEAQAIILPYATAITAIPDDKCQEVYDKLIALEG